MWEPALPAIVFKVVPNPRAKQPRPWSRSNVGSRPVGTIDNVIVAVHMNIPVIPNKIVNGQQSRYDSQLNPRRCNRIGILRLVEEVSEEPRM